MSKRKKPFFINGKAMPDWSKGRLNRQYRRARLWAEPTEIVYQTRSRRFRTVTSWWFASLLDSMKPNADMIIKRGRLHLRPGSYIGICLTGAPLIYAHGEQSGKTLEEAETAGWIRIEPFTLGDAGMITFEPSGEPEEA